MFFLFLKLYLHIQYYFISTSLFLKYILLEFALVKAWYGKHLIFVLPKNVFIFILEMWSSGLTTILPACKDVIS